MQCMVIIQVEDNKTIVLTADGEIDGNYETVSTLLMENIKIVASNKNWIGKIYSTITLLLGLNPSRHLYKVMGSPLTLMKNMIIYKILSIFKS